MGLPHRRTVRVNPETDEVVQRIGKEFPPEEALESFARSTS
jgi:hypothetical protein